MPDRMTNVIGTKHELTEDGLLIYAIIKYSNDFDLFEEKILLGNINKLHLADKAKDMWETYCENFTSYFYLMTPQQFLEEYIETYYKEENEERKLNRRTTEEFVKWLDH